MKTFGRNSSRNVENVQISGPSNVVKGEAPKNSTLTFDVNKLDPEVIAIFKAAGIKKKDLEDPKTAAFALQFVSEHLKSQSRQTRQQQQHMHSMVSSGHHAMPPPAFSPLPPPPVEAGGGVVVCGQCGEVNGATYTACRVCRAPPLTLQPQPTPVAVGWTRPVAASGVSPRAPAPTRSPRGNIPTFEEASSASPPAHQPHPVPKPRPNGSMVAEDTVGVFPNASSPVSTPIPKARGAGSMVAEDTVNISPSPKPVPRHPMSPAVQRVSPVTGLGASSEQPLGSSDNSSPRESAAGTSSVASPVPMPRGAAARVVLSPRSKSSVAPTSSLAGRFDGPEPLSPRSRGPVVPPNSEDGSKSPPPPGMLAPARPAPGTSSASGSPAPVPKPRPGQPAPMPPPRRGSLKAPLGQAPNSPLMTRGRGRGRGRGAPTAGNGDLQNSGDVPISEDMFFNESGPEPLTRSGSLSFSSADIAAADTDEASAAVAPVPPPVAAPAGGGAAPPPPPPPPPPTAVPAGFVPSPSRSPRSGEKSPRMQSPPPQQSNSMVDVAEEIRMKGRSGLKPVNMEKLKNRLSTANPNELASALAQALAKMRPSIAKGGSETNDGADDDDW